MPDIHGLGIDFNSAHFSLGGAGNVLSVIGSGIAPSVPHNSLLSLQGGTSGEYYHLTSAKYTLLNSYTQTEADLSSAVSLKHAASTVTGGDHGALDATSLTHDDHTQYLLASGARDLSGDWTIATQSITLTAGTLTAAQLVSTGNLEFRGASPRIAQNSDPAALSLSLNGSGWASGTGTEIYNTATTVIKIKFTPYFTKVSGTSVYVIDSSNSYRYTIIVAPGSTLTVVAANTSVFTVAYATWAAAWVEYGSNILTATMAEAGGAASTLVLNGTTIAATGAAFTKLNPASIFVGRYQGAATNLFTGLIDYLYIYSDAAMTTKTADWDFNGSYAPTSVGPTLTAGGSGNSFVGNVERLYADYHTTFTSYEFPASANTDHLLNTAYTRTAGALLDVQNNAVSKFKVDYAGGITVGCNTTALGLLSLTQASAAADSWDVILRKARGTVAVPTVITTGDELGVLSAQGYSGAGGYVTGAAIKFISEGTVATTRVPGRIEFWTGTDAAPTVLTKWWQLDSAGLMTITAGGNIALATSTGTKIGTATNQLLGFYGATPVDQPAAVADATDAASAITQLNLALARLRELGLIAT